MGRLKLNLLFSLLLYLLAIKSWLIKDVLTTIKEKSYQTTEWLEDFTAEVVSVINEENGSYTAKVDPNNKKDLTIFSPKGEIIEGTA